MHSARPEPTGRSQVVLGLGLPGEQNVEQRAIRVELTIARKPANSLVERAEREILTRRQPRAVRQHAGQAWIRERTRC